MPKRAFITGNYGQDGFYLTESLTRDGYSVDGVDKGEGDLGDPAFVETIVKKEYDEIYNLAGVSTVANPHEQIDEIETIIGMAPVYFMDAIMKYSPKTRFFQASSAEMFGDPVESPQSETTPFNPKTPYAVAKVAAHRSAEEYRARGVYAACGILFNHESPRRGEHFVTRKITSTLTRQKKGSTEVLKLGNMDAARDWSFAGDIVEGMRLSLKADKPDTYVFASGITHTVREFVDTAARILDMTPKVEIDPALYRPLEVTTRCGDATKARDTLHWEPVVTFEELVRMMVVAEA